MRMTDFNRRTVIGGIAATAAIVPLSQSVARTRAPSFLAFGDWGRDGAQHQRDVAVQMGFLDTPNGKGYAFAGEPLRDPKYFGDGVGIAVRKGDKVLAERFNSALAVIRENGVYKNVQDHYFKFDIYGE